MNAKTLVSATVSAAVTAFALLASLPAVAADADPGYPTASTSTLTRAQVMQELQQARAAGRIVEGERSYVAPAVGMVKTRAQVRAELREALRIGAIGRGEQSFFPTPEQNARIEQAGLKALDAAMAASAQPVLR
jgi:hypothetical protein